ncbi:MAG: RHS repeat-associated core domain-containing protein [Gemmatimonadetes bacterium]|nr:RHS repeat-associated core domain-containing protein [Gemmatimonadota bacterium]
MYDEQTTGKSQVLWFYPNGTKGFQALAYDSLDRIKAITPNGTTAKTTTFAYNATSGLLSAVTLPTTTNLQVQTYLTPPGQLAQTDFSDATIAAAMRRGYTYDSVGRVRQRWYGSSTGYTARTHTYDPKGQLQSYVDSSHTTTSELVCVDDPNGGFTQICSYQPVQHHTQVGQGSYSYDAAGNRTDHSASVATTTNRLLSFDGYALDYDPDGNLIGKTKSGYSKRLGWNALGQLIADTTNGVVTTFAYDAWGHRVKKVAAGTVTNYILDGDVLLAETDASLNPSREYTYYPGTDQPHSVLVGGVNGAKYYYLYEAPGHAVGLADASGTLVNQYTYEPFGNALTATESISQPIRFSARELDATTGLYYLRARYFDPTLGRFISEDPLGSSGGQNTYVYVLNNPVSLVDPSGTRPCISVNLWIVRFEFCWGDGSDEETSNAGGGSPNAVDFTDVEPRGVPGFAGLNPVLNKEFWGPDRAVQSSRESTLSCALRVRSERSEEFSRSVSNLADATGVAPWMASFAGGAAVNTLLEPGSPFKGPAILSYARSPAALREGLALFGSSVARISRGFGVSATDLSAGAALGELGGLGVGVAVRGAVVSGGWAFGTQAAFFAQSAGCLKD